VLSSSPGKISSYKIVVAKTGGAAKISGAQANFAFEIRP